MIIGIKFDYSLFLGKFLHSPSNELSHQNHQTKTLWATKHHSHLACHLPYSGVMNNTHLKSLRLLPEESSNYGLFSKHSAIAFNNM